MQASGASELRKFSHSKTAISFNILLALQTPLSQKHIHFQVSNYICIHTVQSMQFLLLLMHVWRYIFFLYTQYTDNTLTLRKSVYMRASLENFSHFHILKLLFLSIFCWYFRYFVARNDMLVGSHVPTKFQMYRQKKALLGGEGSSCPPAPPPPLWLR